MAAEAASERSERAAKLFLMELFGKKFLGHPRVADGN
jgi:hypothetical protein